MFQVPETPQWLLSKGRDAESLKSLRWLRGWVDASDVKIEFENLQRYKARTHACRECEKQNNENVICAYHPQESFVGRLRELFRRKNLIPLGIVLCASSNSLFCGSVFSPYFVPILIFYKSPIDPNTVLVWMGYIGPITIVLTIHSFDYIGAHRSHDIRTGLEIFAEKESGISFASVTPFIFATGFHGFFFLDRRNDDNNNFMQKYFPVYGLLLIKFLFNLGIRVLPNLLLSEVFPYRLV